MAGNDQEYKAITQELYKKNLELVNTNQALALLQRLYEIIVSSQDPNKVSEEFINLIVSELHFVSGSVFLIDKSKNVLRLAAAANSPINQKIMASLGKSIADVTVPLTGVKNFLTEALGTKQKMVTSNMLDIWDAWLPSEKRAEVEAIAKSENIQTAFVYPILLGEEAFGVFAVSANISETEITPFEKDLLSRLANVFAVGVDRALFLPLWDSYLSTQSSPIFWAAVVDSLIAFLFWNYITITQKKKKSLKKGLVTMTFGGAANTLAVVAMTWGFAVTTLTSVITVVSSAVPLVSAVLGYFLLKERLQRHQYIGIGAILLGTTLLFGT